MFLAAVKINLAPMVSLVSYSVLIIAGIGAVIWAIWEDRRPKRR